MGTDSLVVKASLAKDAGCVRKVALRADRRELELGYLPRKGRYSIGVVVGESCIVISGPGVPDAGLQSLADRAARLWPDHERNRHEWLRAVQVVRSTRRGWLLDGVLGRTA